ncbi:hypothetical protein EV360DRAFT_76411 [Lentinula raphanica]|nr:hypothetical protein EV360DRAFT_76411 [Lentinula raphanica]
MVSARDALVEAFYKKRASQWEAEEAAEVEHRWKIKEGKKRKAEEEKANKAKKAKVANSGQGLSLEQLQAAQFCQFSRTSSISGGDHSRSRTILQKNVGTGGDPNNDEYPGPDNGEDDSLDDKLEPSGEDGTLKEQEACERCRWLERIEACALEGKEDHCLSALPQQ